VNDKRGKKERRKEYKIEQSKIQPIPRNKNKWRISKKRK
jgi:hypothetical protein